MPRLARPVKSFLASKQAKKTVGGTGTSSTAHAESTHTDPAMPEGEVSENQPNIMAAEDDDDYLTEDETR